MGIKATTEFDVKENILDMFYPIGTTYITKDMNFNPNTAWGGTWVRVEGSVIVGYSTTDTDYNSTTKSGGAKSTNIAHVHTLSGEGAGARITGSGTGIYMNAKSDLEKYTAQYKLATGTPAWESMESTYGAVLAGKTVSAGGAVDVRQPYVVRCIWERTA